MLANDLAVELRPRPPGEAADLGVRLVQHCAASMVRTVGPLYLVLVVVCMNMAVASPFLPMFLLFWLKPWLDRSLLFVLSRALFGQPTRFRDLWQAQRTVWWASVWRTLTLGRLSWRRSFTLPIEQLEGQQGQALRLRRSALLSGQQGGGYFLQLHFGGMEKVLFCAILILPWVFLPWSILPDVFDGMLQQGSSIEAGLLESAWLVVLLNLAYACVVGFLEPFFVGAGFGLYLNRRIQLEGWDIEQDLRRAFG